MKVREFAKHIGVSHVAVLKAAQSGRLNRSVRRDDQGRVVDVEPVLGAKEWANKGRLSPAERNGARDPGTPASAAPNLVLGGLDAIGRPGAPFLGIRIPLDAFLEGASSALREVGKEPTPDALRAAVAARGDAAWWVAAFAALSAAFEGELSAEEIAAMWEAEGHEAVLGEEDGHGHAG